MFRRGQELQDCLGIALPRTICSTDDYGDYQVGVEIITGKSQTDMSGIWHSHG